MDVYISVCTVCIYIGTEHWALNWEKIACGEHSRNVFGYPLLRGGQPYCI